MMLELKPWPAIARDGWKLALETLAIVTVWYASVASNVFLGVH